MSSGTKKLITNSRERAVSNDLNRLQDFQQAAFAEVMRALVMPATSELFSRGNGVVPSASAAPMSAVILNGFLCKPQIASADLFIDPGTMVVVDADVTPNSDDSICKIAKSTTGVTTPGTISFLAAGVSTRIDVVEVARVDPSDPSTHVETASRDIYNPATGVFTAASVTKATDGLLQYRIWRGTEGAGFPGTRVGWLPLMVAIVPVGATNWDGCVCFDVRPLLADRVSLANAVPSKNTIRDAELVAGFQYEANGGADTRKYINGRVNAVYAGNVVGGSLPAGGLDLSTNDYAVPSFISGMADGWWSLYLAFPSGLPRWCRYTPASVGYRLPSGLCGIPVASQQACDVYGSPTAAITLPTNLGLTGTTVAAIRVFTAPCTAVSKLLPTSVDGAGWYSIAKAVTAPTVVAPVTGSGGSGKVWKYDLVEGTHVPVGTKAVEVYSTFVWTPASGVTSVLAEIETYTETQATAFAGWDARTLHDGPFQLAVYGDGATPTTHGFVGTLSLPPSWPGLASPWAAHVWHLGTAVIYGSGSVSLVAGTVTAEVRRYKL